MKITKCFLLIGITGFVLAIAGHSFSKQEFINGKVIKVDDNNAVTIEPIQADIIPDDSRVELFFKISEEESIPIGEWKVSGRGKGVIYATAVDVVGPPQKGMSAKISSSDKQNAPVITSDNSDKKKDQEPSREKSNVKNVSEIRGKEPKKQLLGIPFPDKTAKEYAAAGDRYYFKEKNYRKAFTEYEKCARMGHSGCQTMLAHLYYNGNGISKNYQKAIEWYETSARQNNFSAMYNLGVMYQKGQGVKKDYNKAVELFSQSATSGYAEAQFNLGGMYYNGMGVSKDRSEALKWFKKAAANDIPKALYLVGNAHEYGWGNTSKNRSKAMEYYKKAAELGDSQAIEKIKN